MTKDADGSRLNWFVFLLLAIIGWFSYTFVNQQSDLNAVNRDYAAARERLAAARERNETLRVERDSLNDLAYIEKVAREDLGMTRRGEMPYISAHR